MNIGDLLVRNANKFPDKPAVVSETLSLTFQELNDRVNRLANSLLDSGLRKGERIGVLVHNGHQFLELYFASAKTGAVFCPYNNHFKQSELKDIIDYSTPRFLIVDRDYAEMVSALKPGLKSVEKYICLQKTSLPSMDDYETLIARSRGEEPSTKVLEDDVLSIIFTGGTTGKPKGAMRTTGISCPTLSQASLN